ncbi:hypothetical protein TYRP_012887 [Tyrophagus putrescentiae]|nr:hypothetical protein TYRP_012887 [Tyrophagus putrescentiae]
MQKEQQQQQLAPKWQTLIRLCFELFGAGQGSKSFKRRRRRLRRRVSLHGSLDTVALVRIGGGGGEGGQRVWCTDELPSVVISSLAKQQQQLQTEAF